MKYRHMLPNIDINIDKYIDYIEQNKAKSSLVKKCRIARMEVDCSSSILIS